MSEGGNERRESVESADDRAKRASVEAEEEEEENKKNQAKKLETFEKVIDYIDDAQIYKPRIKTSDRMLYWNWVIQNNWRPSMHHDFKSWTAASRQNDFSTEVQYYPLYPTYYLIFSLSQIWDYIYLSLFILWLLLLGASTDGFVTFLSPSFVQILLLLMMVSQIISVLGAVIGVVFYNDLAKFLARTMIGKWVIKLKRFIIFLSQFSLCFLSGYFCCFSCPIF
jgi:hypothetical protein